MLPKRLFFLENFIFIILCSKYLVGEKTLKSTSDYNREFYGPPVTEVFDKSSMDFQNIYSYEKSQLNKYISSGNDYKGSTLNQNPNSNPNAPYETNNETILKTLIVPTINYEELIVKNRTNLGLKTVLKKFNKSNKNFHPMKNVATNYSVGRFNSDEEKHSSLCQKPASIRKIYVPDKTNISTNGRNYLIAKVIKSRKCIKKKQKNEMIQRRNFNIFSNSPAIVSVPWMTRKAEIDSDNFEDSYYNSLETPSAMERKNKSFNDVDNLNSNVKQGYNGNKFQKFLNLFTIVKFDNGNCYFNGLTGTCLHQIQCQAKGGKSIGSCAKGFGICCYVEKTCGGRTKHNYTYFVNEGFPQPSTNAPRICTLEVEKANLDVQQLRLDFILLELRGPNNGTCISDRLTITGQNVNDLIPDICGTNNQQHVYVDVDQNKGPFNLNIITMGEIFPRTFQIKITQIRKNDELLAPKNCLQYFTEPTGTVQTFNYQYSDLGNLTEFIPGYFNNLNYVICLKKQDGFCSISYENEEIETENDLPSFQLMNTDAEGERLLPPSQGGAELFDCPDDYIVINGIRLCGEKLNDARLDPDNTKNYPVTDISNGPFMLQVRTNNAINGRGFRLKYRQNPCLL